MDWRNSLGDRGLQACPRAPVGTATLSRNVLARVSCCKISITLKIPQSDTGPCPILGALPTLSARSSLNYYTVAETLQATSLRVFAGHSIKDGRGRPSSTQESSSACRSVSAVLLKRLQTPVDLVPVHHVPPGGQVLGTPIVVFQIVGVLPHVI